MNFDVWWIPEDNQMAEASRPTGPDIFDLALSGQAPGFSQLHLEGTTRSGRPFKYELTEYQVRPGTTPEAALELARRIVRDKYRESDWDRRHPHVDVELELVFAFTSIILGVVGRLEGKEPVKPLWVTKWGIMFDDELVEVYPEGSRATAEQRLRELVARDGDRYSLRPLTRIGFLPAVS